MYIWLQDSDCVYIPKNNVSATGIDSSYCAHIATQRDVLELT